MTLRPYWKKHRVQARFAAAIMATIGTPVFLLFWLVDQLKEMEWSDLSRFYKDLYYIIIGKGE